MRKAAEAPLERSLLPASAAVTTEKVRGIDRVNGTEKGYGLCFRMPSALCRR